MAEFFPVRHEHLTSEELTAYIDGVIGEEERSRLERHFTTCARCLDEIVALTKMLRPDQDDSTSETSQPR